MYIIYKDNASYSVSKEEFKAINHIGANVFDPKTGEMFIVFSDKLTPVGKVENTVEPETPVEPEPETPVDPEPEVPAEPEPEIPEPVEPENPEEEITE